MQCPICGDKYLTNHGNGQDKDEDGNEVTAPLIAMNCYDGSTECFSGILNLYTCVNDHSFYIEQNT
jgi:hypothetical protein